MNTGICEGKGFHISDSVAYTRLLIQGVTKLIFIQVHHRTFAVEIEERLK